MTGSRTLFSCVVVVSLIGQARADRRAARTTEAVTLRKGPGERHAAVAPLPADAEVEIVAEEGRWVRVRVNALEGYLTRTTVTQPSVPLVESAAWSAKRTLDGQPVLELLVTVAAPTALLRGEPTPTAARVADLARGARLAVLDASNPRWIHVRDDHGHTGWVTREEIGEAVAAPPEDTGNQDKELVVRHDRFTRRTTPALGLRGELGVGLRSFGMDLTSNAAGGLTNYLVDADAIAVTLDLDAVIRLAGPAFIAVDARAQWSNSSPGIDYPGPTSTAGTIAFATYAGDLGLRGGVRVKQALDLSLRAGVHYDAFVTTDVDNAGMLPRERLLGATLGARAEILPPRSRFSAALRFDALVIGARAQTLGLEDGTSSTSRALWGGATVRCQLGARWAVFGGVDLGRVTTRWTGMSVRLPGVTRVERIDSTQLVQLGIGAEL